MRHLTKPEAHLIKLNRMMTAILKLVNVCVFHYNGLNSQKQVILLKASEFTRVQFLSCPCDGR